jgi:hypothetical protein
MELSGVLERGEADQRLMQRVAQRLAEFHAAAATGPGIDEYGSLAMLRANWDEHFFKTNLVEPWKRDAIQAYVDQFLSQNAELIERRIASGRVRDGHGDLHAANVCTTRRRVYLLNRVEFNPRFRCADVAAEVAFLAMDLEHLGHAELAAAFVDAYVRYSGDAELLQFLNFFKCYGAVVRGKIEDGYLDLAYACARPLPRTMLIVTMGLPGSGKTSLTRDLACRLGLIYLCPSDAFEGGMYMRAVTRRTYAVLRRKAARWLRRGRSVVLDAPFERRVLRRLAHHTGAQLYVIGCRTDEVATETRLVDQIIADLYAGQRRASDDRAA